MARKASVRYWKSRNGYCAHIDGRQTLLASGPDDGPDGPTFKAAEEEFKRRTYKGIFGPTFADLAGAYLAWYRDTHKQSSATAIADRLRPLTDAFASRHVSQVSGPQIETWVSEQRRSRGWSDSTVRLTLRAISAAVRYGVRSRMFSAAPWDALRLPPEGSRGMEVVLTPTQVEVVMDATHGPLKELCIILRDTGCRPGEATSAEVRHFDPQLGAIVLPATSRDGPTHKTAGKTGKARVIYLRGESLALVTRLASESASGPLLRTAGLKRTGPTPGKRGPWTSNGITQAFKRLRERCGIDALIPYSFRHTFAAARLREGWSADALAVVMGTSRLMIERHYGHLSEQRGFLRSLVDGIDSGKAP